MVSTLVKILVGRTDFFVTCNIFFKNCQLQNSSIEIIVFLVIYQRAYRLIDLLASYSFCGPYTNCSVYKTSSRTFNFGLDEKMTGANLIKNPFKLQTPCVVAFRVR